MDDIEEQHQMQVKLMESTHYEQINNLRSKYILNIK